MMSFKRVHFKEPKGIKTESQVRSLIRKQKAEAEQPQEIDKPREVDKPQEVQATSNDSITRSHEHENVNGTYISSNLYNLRFLAGL